MLEEETRVPLTAPLDEGRNGVLRRWARTVSCTVAAEWSWLVLRPCTRRPGDDSRTFGDRRTVY